MAFNIGAIGFNQSSGVGEGINAAAENFLRAYQLRQQRKLQEQQAATQQQQATLQTQAMQREAQMAPLREALARAQAFQSGVKPADVASDTTFNLPTINTLGAPVVNAPAFTIARGERFVPLGGGTLPIASVSDATQANVPEQGGFVFDTLDNPVARARNQHEADVAAQAQATRDAARQALRMLYAREALAGQRQDAQNQFTAGQNAANRANALKAAGIRAQATGTGPSWQTVPTPDGYVQVNPKTGEARPVMAPGTGVPTPTGTAQPLGALATQGGQQSAPQQLQPRESGTIRQSIAGNRVQLKVIDDAIAELGLHPDAVGLKRAVPFIGDIINQRADSAGVSARAALANIGSLTFHDRSGAAVTAAEMPRLQPFIPGVHDTKAAAIEKLQKLRAAIEAETEALSQSAGGGSTPGSFGNYSPDNPFAQRP